MSSVLPSAATTANSQQNTSQSNHVLNQTQLPPPPSNSTDYNHHINHTTTPHNNNINTNISSNNNINNKVVNNGGYFNPKKRSLEEDPISRLDNSRYFKMRVLLAQLRPLFIQARDAPDFDNNEARFAIQEKMKVVVDLCRQEAVSQANNESGNHYKQGWQFQDTKPAVQNRQAAENHAEKQTHDNYRIPGSYIVGGSAFGWNFLMFHASKPEYYGRTKEAFRAGK